MATGGAEVDNRVTCSVCLEPYRGRQPKILPCFHTFCLPCLTRLVEGETSGVGSTDDETQPAASLACPTCRRVTPVPLGGVVEFQANFYVEDSSSHGGTQALPCNLCDGVHDASYQCHKCERNFCTECRRYHDKLCMGSQVTGLQQACSFSSSSVDVEGATCYTVKQQLQKVEGVMKKLTEEEKKVKQERRIVENGIHDRYATLLGHAGEARDACLTSLRETCQGVTDCLQSHMARAKQAQDTLTQQVCSQPSPISVPQLNTALFLGGDLQTILDTDSDRREPLLRHEMKDNSETLISCMQSFMGRVVGSGQAAGSGYSRSSAAKISAPCNGVSSVSAELSSLSAGAGDLQSMQQKLDDLSNRVTQLSQHVTLLGDSSSSKVSTLEKELAAVKDKMAADQTTAQREMATLQDKNTKLSTDQTALQKDVQALRDKNAIAQQDLAVMTSEKDQLRAEVGKLQQDVISLQTDSSMLQADVMQLKTDRDSVMTHVSTAQNDIAALQGDINIVKNDVGTLEADHTTVRSDVTTIQNDVKTLQGDVITAQNDITALQRDVITAKNDISAVHGNITTARNDITSLQNDVKTTKNDITRLETAGTTVRSDISTVQNDIQAIQGDNKSTNADLTMLKAVLASHKADHNSLKSDISAAQKHITALQGNNSALVSDITSSKDQLASLQQRVQSAQDSVRKRSSKLRALETRLNKAGVQVAFHAVLKRTVTTTKEQALVCDGIITNVGSGYSRETGEFTAPVAGTYSFMATTSPNKADNEQKVKLDIMLGNDTVGYVYAVGWSWSTGHTVIKVSAGQKVWLRTYSDGEYTFSDGWWTTFSGMLVQPDF